MQCWRKYEKLGKVMFWNGEICAGLLSLYETFPDESSIDAKDKTRTKIFFFL